MNTVGYYYDESVVCVPCHELFVAEARDAVSFGERNAEDLREWLDNAEPATFIGLPDGFTCDECASVIFQKGDNS